MQFGIGAGLRGDRLEVGLGDETRERACDGRRRGHLVLLKIGIYESSLSEAKGNRQQEGVRPEAEGVRRN